MESVFILFLGGGSALLPAPVPPLTLQDIYDVSKILAMKGCTIAQLNTIRKHMSKLKGGGLAQVAYPAQVGEFQRLEGSNNCSFYLLVLIRFHLKVRQNSINSLGFQKLLHVVISLYTAVFTALKTLDYN